MAKKFKTWNNKSIELKAPQGGGATPKSTGGNNNSWKQKWFVCSRTPSRALELILKTALPHYYLESEQQGQSFSVNSWTEVIQDYWDGLASGKCPRIQDIPGFKLDQGFSQGFSLTFPNATKRHFMNSETGSGAITQFSIPPNVTGYANPFQVDVELLPGSWNGKYYEYDDTIQLSPSWTYHSARRTAPVPDYCIPAPGTNLFNTPHVSKPGLYSDNGTGYPSVGWKGNSNATMHENLIAPQFQSNSFPSNMYNFSGNQALPAYGTSFGPDTWKASLHAQAYYIGRGSYRYEGNANNPATYRQYDALSNQSNAVLAVAPQGFAFNQVQLQTLTSSVSGTMIFHDPQTFQQALNSTNLTDTCSNKPIFSNENIISTPQANYNEGTASSAEAHLRAFGKDTFNMALNTVDGSENNAIFSIDGFWNGVFEVTVPIWWSQGWEMNFSTTSGTQYSACSCHPMMGLFLYAADGTPLAANPALGYPNLLPANVTSLIKTTDPDNVLFVESTVKSYDDGGYWGNCGYPASGSAWSFNTGRFKTTFEKTFKIQTGVPYNKNLLYMTNSPDNNKAKLDDLEGVSWFNSNQECRDNTVCRKCKITAIGGEYHTVKHKYLG